MSATKFSHAYLIRSSIKNGSLRSVDFTSADLCQSDTSNEPLFPINSVRLAFHIFLSIRFLNGSFVYLEKQTFSIVDQSAAQMSRSSRMLSKYTHLSFLFILCDTTLRRSSNENQNSSTIENCFLLEQENQVIIYFED